MSTTAPFEVPAQDVATKPYKVKRVLAVLEIEFPLVPKMEPATDPEGKPLFVRWDNGELTTDARTPAGLDATNRPHGYRRNMPHLVRATRMKEDGSEVPRYKGASAAITVGLVGANGVPGPDGTGKAANIRPETVEALMGLLMQDELPHWLESLEADGVAE